MPAGDDELGANSLGNALSHAAPRSVKLLGIRSSTSQPDISPPSNSLFMRSLPTCDQKKTFS